MSSSSGSAPLKASNTRAVFLDRDGVVNAMLNRDGNIDSPQSPDELRLLPGSAEAIRRLNMAGIPVALVSNQPGIAKGKSTPELLAETTALLETRLQRAGAKLGAICYCLHHPLAVVPEYRASCECRKPGSGLLIQAAGILGVSVQGSYMVGDSETDIVAGRSVGCTTVLIRSPRNGSLARASGADRVFGTLLATVDWILANEPDPNHQSNQRCIRSFEAPVDIPTTAESTAWPRVCAATGDQLKLSGP